MIISMKNKTFKILSRLSIAFLILFFVLSLSACVKRGSTKKNKFAPPKQVVKKILPQYNGAIYQEGMPISLFEDTTARRKGDVVTIKLVEAASAGSTVKRGSEGAGPDAYLFTPTTTRSPVSIPRWNW